MALPSPFAGAIAGFVATAPMTAVMMALHRLLPWLERYPLPPSQITTRMTERLGFRGRVDKREHLALTTLAHFGYGAAAGAVYGPIAARWRPAPLVGGIAFALAVWLASYMGLLPALALVSPASEHPTRRNALMIFAHIVWGSALGLLMDGLSRRHEREPQPGREELPRA